MVRTNYITDSRRDLQLIVPNRWWRKVAVDYLQIWRTCKQLFALKKVVRGWKETECCSSLGSTPYPDPPKSAGSDASPKKAQFGTQRGTCQRTHYFHWQTESLSSCTTIIRSSHKFETFAGRPSSSLSASTLSQAFSFTWSSMMPLDCPRRARVGLKVLDLVRGRLVVSFACHFVPSLVFSTSPPARDEADTVLRLRTRG